MSNPNQAPEFNRPTELEAVLDGLRTQFQLPNLVLGGPPQQLSGGFWAENWILNFAPPSKSTLPDRVVLRIAPDPILALWENTIQSGVAKQGYPTPKIYFSDTAHGDNRAWCIMEFVDGMPLLPGIEVVRTFAKLPRLAKSISETLARATADLHRIDIEPIEPELAKLSDQPISADGLIDEYLSRISELPDLSLRNAVKALAANRPVVSKRVICHGDMHPFNVLVRDSNYIVLDWTSARIADPVFDVAYTSLLVANPPLKAPKVLRPTINWTGRFLTKRFLASYEEFSKTNIHLDAFEWYQALQALRIIFDLENWKVNDIAGTRSGHPWFIMEPALRKLVVKFQ
ncbi:MAG: phosphotransferase [Ilumatobacteraceae bacterium]